MSALAFFVGDAGAASPTRWIVFAAAPEHGTLPTQLFRISTTGTGLRQLTTGVRAATEPSFAPDGRQIAFTRAVAGIFVTRADGSGLHRLTPGPNDRFPVWSPTGREVAFVHPVGQHTRVAVIASDGRRRRTLRLGPEPMGRPAWTPDGRSLVVATADGVFVRIDARTGKAQRRLGPSYDTRDGTPSWSLSPNGRTIALVGRAPSPPGCAGLACEAFAVYVAGVSSPRFRRLVEAGSFPGWTPDGRRVVFATSLGIDSVPLAGGQQRTIAVGAGAIPAGDAPPAWQP